MLRCVHKYLHRTLTYRAGSDDDDDDDMDEDDADLLPDDPYHLPINHEVTLQVSRKAQFRLFLLCACRMFSTEWTGYNNACGQRG